MKQGHPKLTIVKTVDENTVLSLVQVPQVISDTSIPEYILIKENGEDECSILNNGSYEFWFEVNKYAPSGHRLEADKEVSEIFYSLKEAVQSFFTIYSDYKYEVLDSDSRALIEGEDNN